MENRSLRLTWDHEEDDTDVCALFINSFPVVDYILYRCIFGIATYITMHIV